MRRKLHNSNATRQKLLDKLSVFVTIQVRTKHRTQWSARFISHPSICICSTESSNCLGVERMGALNGLQLSSHQTAVLSSLKKVVDSGKYIEGAFVFMLEKQFSALVKSPSAITFNSVCSAAYTLFKTYFDFGIRSVAIQNNSSAMVAIAALEAGLTLHLVDSAPDCPAMGLDQLVEVSKECGPRLVLLSHVGGWQAKHYEAVADWCMDQGIALIEDCTSVLGVGRETWGSPGTLSEAAIWGFSPTSAVPAAGGGILTASNLEVRNAARAYRSGGKYLSGMAFKYAGGLDFRMSELDAALICSQLEQLGDTLAARARDAQKLQLIAPSLLEGPTNWECYPVEPAKAIKKLTIPCMFALPDQLVNALEQHRQRMSFGALKNSSTWASNHRCLPVGEDVYAGMDDKQIADYIRSL